MPLFQEKIIAKALGPNIGHIPEQHRLILENWREKIESDSLLRQTEVAIHAPFMQKIMVEVLGYTPFGAGDFWTIAREYGVAGGAVDLALGHFTDDKAGDRVLAPFELKGARTRDLDAIMPGRHKTPVQQAWEYARDIKGAQWVLLCNYVELRLSAVSETSLVYERFNMAELADPRQYARFILLLHADNLLSGNTAKLLNQSLLADKEITAQLYEDYKLLRELLISCLIRDNPDIAAADLIAPAQKLLDRFLFIAFAEDKGLIPETSIQKAHKHTDPYNPRPVYENFKGLFRAIDQGSVELAISAYNGGLFAEDAVLNGLKVADEVCFAVSELASYDFDFEISVTGGFLGAMRCRLTPDGKRRRAPEVVRYIAERCNECNNAVSVEFMVGCYPMSNSWCRVGISTRVSLSRLPKVVMAFSSPWTKKVVSGLVCECQSSRTF